MKRFQLQLVRGQIIALYFTYAIKRSA
jgi:hypothetical protein